MDEHGSVTEEGKKDAAKMIKDEFGFDDVVVDNVQDFIREVEE